MHYPKGAFSIDKSRLNTIEVLGDASSDIIGQRKRLSELDIKRLNIMYQCNSQGTNKAHNQWQNV